MQKCNGSQLADVIEANFYPINNYSTTQNFRKFGSKCDIYKVNANTTVLC